jgi:CheY-like chemotaxis protein/HPt (histidine-containing phosphotransfer) domain-containing protein
MRTNELKLGVAGRRVEILLAEDNRVNELMARRLLENWGCAVTSVGNGCAAVEAASMSSFDLVLMDVEMPEMDGMTATRTIRGRENQTAPRMPVIAMTAHATESDRERCLQAGMDGYVSKPIGADQLLEAIRRVLGEKLQAPSAAPEPAEKTAGPDRSGCCGCADLEREIVEAFLEEAPQLLEQVQRAWTARNPSELASAAHALKGAAAQVRGSAVFQGASALETAGRSGDLTNSQVVFEQLQVDLNRFTSALLGELVKSNGS